MYIWLWLTVITAGAAGQLVDAAAGMGFGAFSSTIMIAGGISPVLVVATVNLAKVGSGLASGLAHWRLGNIRRAWVAPLAIPGIAGGVLAAILITRLPEAATRFWVPIILVLMGLLILWRSFSGRSFLPRVAGASHEWAPPVASNPWASFQASLVGIPSSFWLGVIGFFGGIINGLSGAFGPFATTSVILVKNDHPRYAIGTVNLAEFFVAAAISTTLILRLDWSAFRWQLPLALMVGSVITAPIGAYLARHMPARVLGVVVGAVLISLNVWSVLRAAL